MTQPVATPPERASLRGFGRGLRAWPARRWLLAGAATLATVVVVAVPTDLIDTPFFGREVAPTPWAWPVLLTTAVLAGLLSATYVAPPAGAEPRRREGRAGLAGAFVTFFAVGCPVCNKLVLLALGTTGAMAYFEPVQPYLAAASILLLGWALWARVTREDACRLPRRSAARVAERSNAL